MKVGTDGVLLGAWCGVEESDEAILDIGTGTGVIALQLAQRTQGARTRIEAVEVDEASAAAAKRNFAASPWADRLTLHAMTAQELATRAGGKEFAAVGQGLATGATGATAEPWARFDHIVSNPPYFVDSLTGPRQARNIARHAEALTYEDLIEMADKLLRPAGRLSLVLPAGPEAQKMTALAGGRGFVPRRITEVHSTPRSGPKRVLMEFRRGGQNPGCAAQPAAQNTAQQPERESLVIEDAGPGTFSAEYRALTSDFYLYF